MNPEKKKPLEFVVEATKVLAPVAFLYLAAWWGFKKDVKDEVWERQGGECGEPGCTRPILEYHHIVPENMLKRNGIKGKNTADNAVGLCFDHHKHKWDVLASKGIFYPGVELEELNPDTYVNVNKLWRNKREKKHRR